MLKCTAKTLTDFVLFQVENMNAFDYIHVTHTHAPTSYIISKYCWSK